MLAWLLQCQEIVGKRLGRPFNSGEVTSQLKEHYWKAVNDSDLLVDHLVEQVVLLGVPREMARLCLDLCCGEGEAAARGQSPLLGQLLAARTRAGQGLLPALKQHLTEGRIASFLLALARTEDYLSLLLCMVRQLADTLVKINLMAN